MPGILEKFLRNEWLLWSASLLSERITSRSPPKCYILFDGGWYRERRIGTQVMDKTWYWANEAGLKRVEGINFSEPHFFISVKLQFFTLSLPEFQWEHALPRVPLLEFSPSCVFVMLSSWACCKNLLSPLCFPDSPVHQNHLRIVKYTYFQALLPRDSNSGGLDWGLGDF